MTITGSDFTGASAVQFGGAAATSFTVDSATQITATSPAQGAGPVDVTVTTPFGDSAVSAADRYSYAYPTLTLSVSGSQTYGGSQVELSYTASPVAFKTPKGQRLTCSVPAGLSVGTSTLDVSGCSGLSAPSGYVLAYQGEPDGFTVNPAPLSITASSPADMTYGGPVPAVTPAYSGFVAGDDPASLTTGPTCSVAAVSDVGGYDTSCSGAVDPNYAISYLTGQLQVTKAPLVITASSASMSYGDTPPTITPSYAGFVAGDTASVLSGLSCSSTATATSSPGPYPSSCSGAAATNYDIRYTDGTVTLGQHVVTVTASDAHLTYGDDAPTITPAYSGFANGATAPATAPTCTTTATHTSTVGSAQSSHCGGAADPNYTFVYVPGTVTVSPAPVTITASDGSFDYGTTPPTVTAQLSGLVNGENPSVLGGGFGCTSTATSSSPVTAGGYPSGCSGDTDPNYTASYVPGTITVTPAPLTVTASDAAMVYGGAVPAITASYAHFVNGEDASSLGQGVSCAVDATGGLHVGTHATACRGAQDPNYAISYPNGTLQVTPAPLSVTASSASIPYGAAVPAITATYAGFTNGDTAAALTTPPVCDTTATSSSHVGSYPSNCTGAAGRDYTITYQPGSVSIGQHVLVITAATISKVYGAAVPAVGASYSGFVNGDTPAALTTKPSCAALASTASHASSYPTRCSGAADADYTITYIDGSLAITPAPLSVTAASPTMTYQASVPTINPSYNGLVNNDTAASLTRPPACTSTATTSSPPGSYATSCAGAVDPDYTISYTGGTLQVLLVAGCANAAAYGTGQNLAGANLAGKNLAGKNLAGANLAGANLAGANLAGANLSAANLQGADLSGANLQGATLTGANLVGATITGANLQGDDISCADLQGANLKGANLQKTTLTADNLTSINGSGTNLQTANLSRTNLTMANLSGANLQSDDLTAATLAGANLKGANTNKITWTGATCPDNTTAAAAGGTCTGHLT